MTLAQQLFAALTVFAALAVQRVQAIDSINVINVSLKYLVEGDGFVQGNNDVFPVRTVRVSTRDLIELLGEEKSISFGPRAQVLLLRRNFGQDDQSATIIIREPGRPDSDVNDYLGFNPGAQILSGVVNVITGRTRGTLNYIGTLAIDVPGKLSLLLSGSTTEKAGTIVVDGQEVGGATYSVVSNLAGEGIANDQFLVVEGTMRLGAAKLVPSAE